jgi:hypothetical protein
MKTMTKPFQKVRHVLLFSGHMIDAASRKTPRFPSRAESAAAAAIETALRQLQAGPDDLGLTEGACGGDLLFAEALLARGASLQLRLPFHEARFRKKSIAYPKKKPPSDRWLSRFLAVRDHPRVTVHAMPDSAVSLPRIADPYERCNRWMLRDALAFGATRVRFICLWNGEKPDGRGGTAHMMRCVQEQGGQEVWLDTRKLWSV